MDIKVRYVVQLRHMIRRLSNLSKSRSFFLFGPRGTGKSTLLKSWMKDKSATYVNLLDPTSELELVRNPKRLLENWQAEPTDWIIVDEIQKIPALLDVVHMGIEDHKIKFALTGSSARKLRRGTANLLGGRAFDFHLHPITFVELKKKFNLIDILSYGSLPEILSLDKNDKERALYSYISVYLKEEILIEQVIRKIEPFRQFLEVAAQMNGKILNYAKISRDSGVEEKSIGRYYQILDDTLLGFHLPPYHHSIRKRQSQKAKFYFFDCGVTRALQNSVTLALTPQTTSYGDLFEQLVILEFIRLNDYFEKRFKFSYLKTKDNLEIDLIIERPGKATALIEIKSSDKINSDDGRSIRQISSEFKKCDLYVLSNIKKGAIIDGVHFLNWQQGILDIMNISSEENE